MAHTLRDAGYEVLVMCGRANYPTGRVFPEQRHHSGVVKTIQEGVQIVRLPFLPSRSPRRYVRMGSLATLALSALWHGPKIIRDFAPQLLLASSPPLPLATAGARLARRQGIPFALNVSDLWPLTARELGALQPGLLYKFLEQRERALFRQAAGWLGQSEEILGYMQRHAGAQKPAFLYRNLPVAQLPLPVSIPTAGTPLRLVYAGLLGPVQGILEIVKAVDFKQLGFTLDIYGDGICRAEMEQFVRENPERGVQLCGLVPAAQMSRLLPRYDVGIACLNQPVFGAVPSKLFAAVGAGLPVLFCGGGEGEKLVQQYHLGWTVPPGDTAAFAGQLQKLQALLPAQWQLLQECCRQVAGSIFNREEQDRAFVDFVNALCPDMRQKNTAEAQ